MEMCSLGFPMVNVFPRKPRWWSAMGSLRQERSEKYESEYAQGKKKIIGCAPINKENTLFLVESFGTADEVKAV